MIVTKASVSYIPADLRHDLLQCIGNGPVPSCESLIQAVKGLGVPFPMLDFLQSDSPFNIICETIRDLVTGVNNQAHLALKKTIREKSERIKCILLEMVIQIAKYEISSKVTDSIHQTTLPSYTMGMPIMAHLLLCRRDTSWAEYSRIPPKVRVQMTDRIRENPVLFISMCRYLNLDLGTVTSLAIRTPYPLVILETLGIQLVPETRKFIRTELQRRQTIEEILKLYISAINM